jgi:UDPglucose 6-dehydrogenase
MNIGIIGTGIVGTAMINGFNFLKHNLFVFDKKNPETNINSVLLADIIFICVPTDPTAAGDCDTSQVEMVIEELFNLKYSGIIAIKSTVSPGTTDKLSKKYNTDKICFVPEFLRADFADFDFMSNQNILIVGTTNQACYDTITNLHGILITGGLIVSPTEAELSKYFCNTLHATKIIFANAFYEVCQKLNADYEMVLSAAVSRPSVGNSNYLKCNDNLRGFKGKCLPKDILAFSKVLEELNIPASLFTSVIHDNQYFNKEKE